jgi:3-deoxy-7-phosphoheptulonate synthase
MSQRTGVTECVDGSVENEDELQRHYTSLCDLRLNAKQAAEPIEAWDERFP